MAKIITRAVLKKMWPAAPAAMLSGVVSAAPDVFARYGLTTPIRIAHFMAQISHESGGGTVTSENLTYIHAERIAAVWPKRFTVASAEPYVRNPQALAEYSYGGRMGNVRGSGDAYKYRGRGLLQITGRDSYTKMSALTGLDLVDDPDLAFDPAHALEIAAAEFKMLNCLPAADKDDCDLVTKRVNGGYNGLAERRAWLAKWKGAIAAIPDTATDIRMSMSGADVPRYADECTPDKGTLSTPEGKGAATAAGIGLLQSVNEYGAQAKALKDTGESLGVANILGHLVVSPSFLLFAAAIIAVCLYLWFAGGKRLRIEWS